MLIHGESYLWGAGHLMDGGQLAVNSRLVVVTLNYRLGILGTIQVPLICFILYLKFYSLSTVCTAL